MTNEELVKNLKEQADGLARLAEMNEVVAAHFRPKFEACWERREDGSTGKITDPDLVLKLRYYVLDKEHEARAWRREEAALRLAAERLVAI